MNTTSEVQVSVETQPEVKAVPKYLAYQTTQRKRFSFGNAWLNAVLGGVVKDHNKLIAHAVKLNCGRKYDLKKLKFETLLAKVQNKIMAE